MVDINNQWLTISRLRLQGRTPPRKQKKQSKKNFNASIPVLKSSVVFSWHAADGNHGLGATAGLSSSARIENPACRGTGQASSGARKFNR
jgi:hypothetical protein